MNPIEVQTGNPNAGNHKMVFLVGAISTLIVLAGTIMDIVFGTISGGDLTTLPQTAIERFSQFQLNPWLGLYNLDLLNAIDQLIMIPVFFALFAASGNSKNLMAMLSFIVFLAGTLLIVSGNAALPMYELSQKYFAAGDLQKSLYTAAGEGFLVKGTHGSLGMFFGFFLPNVAGIMISAIMLKQGIFSRATAWLGLIGSCLICVYLILVTFVPDIKSMATLFAAPGGLMLIAWMVLFAARLFRLAK
jgi:hypothetical protein